MKIEFSKSELRDIDDALRYAIQEYEGYMMHAVDENADYEPEELKELDARSDRWAKLANKILSHYI